MARLQRLSSPDVVVLSNGRKTGLKASEEYDAEDNNGFPNCSPLEPKPLTVKSNAGSDYRSPSRDPPFFNVSSSEAAHSYAVPSSSHTSTLRTQAKDHGHHQIDGPSHGGVLFQWGHRKRSRGLRTEARASSVAAPAVTEVNESPSHSRQVVKLQRKSSEALAAALPPPCGPYATRTRLCLPGRESRASIVNRYKFPSRLFFVLLLSNWFIDFSINLPPSVSVRVSLFLSSTIVPSFLWMRRWLDEGSLIMRAIWGSLIRGHFHRVSCVDLLVRSVFIDVLGNSWIGSWYFN